jgi:hypothetical protein
LEKRVLGQHGDLEAALGEQQVDEDQPAGAHQPELVDDHRVDQIGVGGRQDRVPVDLEQRLPEAGAEQPAVGLREQRLRDLVALLLHQARRERVLPDVDAVLHVADVCAKNHAPSANSAARRARTRAGSSRRRAAPGSRRRTSATSRGRG